MSRVLPILFNTDMVRAILDGRKTVTRHRVKYDINNNQEINKNLKEQFELYDVTPRCGIPKGTIIKPPYQKGDILYVQEAWTYDSFQLRYMADEYIEYLDEWNRQLLINEDEWNSAGSMTKGLARIWLKVTDVRVEQLQDMTLDDFLSEGVCLNPEAFNDPENAYGQAKRIFTEIWNSTIRKPDQDLYGWDANPWVWVIGFEKCEKPEEEKENGKQYDN